MNSTVPAEVLALKSRFDQWRATRRHTRQRVPDELREAVVELAEQYSPALIRRILKVDPSRMTDSTSKLAPARKKGAAAFFQLPLEICTPAVRSTATDTAGLRLQLERPDGARLTLTLPANELGSIHQFCADFLGDNKQ